MADHGPSEEDILLEEQLDLKRPTQGDNNMADETQNGGNQDGGENQNGESSKSLPSPDVDRSVERDSSSVNSMAQTDNDKTEVGKENGVVDPLQNTETTEAANCPDSTALADKGDKSTHEGLRTSDNPAIVLQSNASDSKETVKMENKPTTSEAIDPKTIQKSNDDITLGKQNVFPSLRPGKAVIGCIPNDVIYSPRDSVSGSRTRIPPKFMRMSTVALVNSSPRPVTRESRQGHIISQKPQRGVTWSEAMNCRPPLKIDLDGPTPCTYSPRNKPLAETNAPSYSFGMKCQPEKNGGGRTSWWKAWFQTPHVWLNKVDFLRDRSVRRLGRAPLILDTVGPTSHFQAVKHAQLWPTPSIYENQTSLGARQAFVPSAPAFTISTKTKTSIVKFPGVCDTPSPSQYSREFADGQTLRRSSSFTHGLRRGGTVPWAGAAPTPGPGHYESTLAAHPACPAFTIQGLRREKSFALGPFSTF